MTNKLPEQVLDRLIRDITDLLTISEDGEVRLTNGLDVIYSDYVNFLYSILLDERLDPSDRAKCIRSKLQEKKLLFGRDVGEPLVGNELKDVFVDLKKRNARSYEDFKRAFYAAIDDRNKMYPYGIAYPLNIKLNSRIESQIKGQDGNKKTFKIVNFDEFRSYFNVGKILNGEFGDPLKRAINAENYFFVVEDVCAGNTAFAENYCKNILQTVLGLLVFSEYYQSMSLKDHYVIRGSYVQVYPPTRISNISVSNALIFKSGKFLTARLFDETGFEPPSDFEEFKKLARGDIAIFNIALNRYNKTQDKIAEMLRNALVSYYKASIDKDLASSYLKYWVCIEFCLLKTKNDKESTMAHMVGKLPFWNAEDSAPKFVKYDAYKARLLSDKRNEYVHELNTDVSQYDRNFAKAIAGGLVQHLLLNGDKFADEKELRQDYRRMIAESEQNLNVALREGTQIQKATPSLYDLLGKK
jgi:hypothetical protein